MSLDSGHNRAIARNTRMRFFALTLHICIISILCASCGRVEQSKRLPWKEQFERIQQAAQEYKKEAVLLNCFVPVDKKVNETFTVSDDIELEITCDYIIPDGTTFTVSYQDLRIEQTLHVNKDGFGRQGGFTEANYAYLQSIPPVLNIGPFDALRAAEADGKQFVQERSNTRTIISLLAEQDVQSEFGIRAIWSVSIFNTLNDDRRILINTQNGEIIAVQDL